MEEPFTPDNLVFANSGVGLANCNWGNRSAYLDYGSGDPGRRDEFQSEILSEIFLAGPFQRTRPQKLASWRQLILRTFGSIEVTYVIPPAGTILTQAH